MTTTPTFFPAFALNLLYESPLNPRKHFDPTKLAELTASVKSIGIQTPITARLFEGNERADIAAGHRRCRAAKAAGLTEVPVIGRVMTDAQFVELLNIDNLQREDVHPLEEAAGYKNLLTLDGYNVTKLAEVAGKGESYVYDRLKLLNLTPDAQKLFLENRFTTGHATILARLTPAQQKKCLDISTGGMWESAYGHTPVGVEDTLGLGSADYHKPTSLRELQAWVDDHIRYVAVDPATPHLFVQTAKNLSLVEEHGREPIHISREHVLKDSAKDKDKRTYCVTSWVRADGEPEPDRWGGKPVKSKTCDHSVMGLIVAGHGRGESFLVCIAKKKCMVHYGDEIRARNAREREREKGPSKAESQQAASNAQLEAARRAEQALREARNAAFDKACDGILAKAGKELRKANTGADSPIATVVMEMVNEGIWGVANYSKQAAKHVPKGKTASTFLAHLAMCEVIVTADHDWTKLPDLFKALKIKVEVESVVAALLPKPAKPVKEAKSK